jgi:hypothetical protein
MKGSRVKLLTGGIIIQPLDGVKPIPTLRIGKRNYQILYIKITDSSSTTYDINWLSTTNLIDDKKWMDVVPKKIVHDWIDEVINNEGLQIVKL